ncbi:MAG TPA: TraB/GumN family protein [Rhodanobacteraceae bacterium]
MPEDHLVIPRSMSIPAVALALLCAGTCAFAQSHTPPSNAAAQPAPASSITTLAAVTVTGVVPGPGLWKVTRGDHVLWILGVVPTLPAHVEWQPAQVAGIIATSQVVIEPPGVKLKVDTSWFGKLFLLPSIYRAQRNPDGKTLQQVLPPPLYAQWDVVRQRYFGNDRGIERYRPFVAAAKLMKRALKANGLHGDGAVTDKVKALATQYHVKLETPQAVLEIREPRQALNAFAASSTDGIACLGLVVDMVEHGIPDLKTRANAWATGDIATLRRVPASAYRDSCKSAVMGAGFAKSLGISDLPARIEGHWLADADATLKANPRSFAVLPMHDLLDAHGYLAALALRGYTITAPDAELDPAAASSTAAPASASSTR